ncbi:MAG: class I SAM-dependent methyltransferase [Thiobacillaceae bacterium]
MNTCHICGNQGKHPHYQPQERMFGWGDQFDYFKCHDCGCLQIADIPTDLPRYYPADYYSLAKTPENLPGWLTRKLNHQRVTYRLTGLSGLWEKLAWRFSALPHDVIQILPYLKPLIDLSRNSRFLDIGCGEHSDWLNTLATCDFQHLTGLDPYLTRPGKRGGIDYLNAPLDQMPGEFDFISLHHSLEHIPDQHESLRQAHRLLAPGGTCLIRIPLVDSAVWEQYGLHWVELDAPRHLYLHTQKSLTRLAQQTGFDVIHTLHDSTAFEFAGSAQYLVDIPLTAPNSFWIDSDNSIFNEDQMNQFRAQAKQANLEGRGGRAAFYLRKRTHS